MSRARIINALFWLYLWLSQALMPVTDAPVTSDSEFWIAKAHQLFQFGPFDSAFDIGRLMGRGLILIAIWSLIDWRLRRRQAHLRTQFSPHSHPEGAEAQPGNPPLGGSSSQQNTIAPMTYIARHWRGEYSLPISYWINSWTSNIVMVLILVSVPFLVDVTKHPVIFALNVSVAWSLVIAISLWQLVGVWRSAGKHKGRGGSGFWAGAARTMVILGFLSSASTLSTQTFPQVAEFWRIAAGDADIGKHELHILRGGTELEYAGGITFGATDDVRKLLDADPAIHVIHINSLGGRVSEARMLRDLIRQRGLVTYTASTCASACTIAFMGGVQRFVAPEAKLGFHRGGFPGVTDEELTAEIDADRRWLMSVGVPAWFVDHAYSTPNDSMWWPTSDELRRAGVITGIARPDDFALSGMPRIDTEEELDKEFQKIPVYVTIKRTDPEVYSKILASSLDARRLGKSEAELAASTREYLSALFKKYLPLASDGSVIAATELAVTEAEAIGKKSADACYDFFYPRPGSKPLIMSEYLPVEVQTRDLSTTASVIETGSTAPQPIPAEKEVSPPIKAIINKLSRSYPAGDIEALANPDSPAVSHETTCRMLTTLYRQVLALPPKDAVRVLRFLFASQ
jgi:hypothetical protein